MYTPFEFMFPCSDVQKLFNSIKADVKKIGLKFVLCVGKF